MSDRLTAEREAIIRGTLKRGLDLVHGNLIPSPGDVRALLGEIDRLRQDIEDGQKQLASYLDCAIIAWRKTRAEGDDVQAPCYVDAFQSVRVSMLGETLPKESADAPA